MPVYAKSIHTMEILRAIRVGADGHKQAPAHWISPTSLRPIILGDNCLLWLKHFGRQHGFEEDPQEGTIMEYITRQGQRFEAKWLSELAPESVTASESDIASRRYGSFLKTVELMARRVPVITKAAVWSARFGVIGSCDMIALASWLRDRFPECAAFLAEGGNDDDYYCVLDMKNQRGLGTPNTAKNKMNLRLASTQVSLYTRALGDLQGRAPSHAFLITPDHIYSPLPVSVGGNVGDPLQTEIADMITLHNRIKQEGADLRPWRDNIVSPNWTNDKDAPWSGAKKKILREYLDHRPLETLPGVGPTQAEVLRAAGFKSADDLITKNARHFDFTRVKGLKGAKARQIQAVLDANHPDQNLLPKVPDEFVPSRREIELFVDFEYITPIRVDIENDWPHLRGRESIFMIGVGWEEHGRWQFQKFAVKDETPEGEMRMMKEFVAFLRDKGVALGSVQEATVNGGSRASLYHWSPAEVAASRRAARRTGLDLLANLPWVDLAKTFRQGPIVLPGQWDFSIKSVSKALSDLCPEFATSYPKDLQAGKDAMALALRAFEHGNDVNQSEEFKTIAAYLEIDCENLYQILRWLRAVNHFDNDSSPREVKGHTLSWLPGGWYRKAIELMVTSPLKVLQKQRLTCKK